MRGLPPTTALPKTALSHHRPPPFPPPRPPPSLCAGLTALLGLHTYLVISGQGTIDLVDNYYSAKDAREAGTEFRNLYDLGFAANWRNTFDVSGPLWWLTWALPSIAPKRGNGYVLSVNLGGRPGSSRQHQVALLV